MVLLGAQSVLQLSPPPVEELLGRSIESQERPLLRCQVLSGHRARLERVQPLEDLHRARPGFWSDATRCTSAEEASTRLRLEGNAPPQGETRESPTKPTKPPRRVRRR